MTALTWLQTGHWLVWDKCCRMQNEQTVKKKLKPVNSCTYQGGVRKTWNWPKK